MDHEQVRLQLHVYYILQRYSGNMAGGILSYYVTYTKEVHKYTAKYLTYNKNVSKQPSHVTV